MGSFRIPEDIVNRALQLLELPRINSLADTNKSAVEMNFAYDKLRRRELRRNMWRFATRRVALRPIASTTVLINPAAYDATVSYMGGAIVTDTSGDLWISMIDNNVGQPLVPPAWDSYIGPLTITPWNVPNMPTTTPASNPYTPPAVGVPYGNQSGISYFPGELTYLQDGKGGITIFRSKGSTGDGPLLLDQWQPNITYTKGQIAFIFTDSLGQIVLNVNPANTADLTSNAFQSTVDFNTANQPDICETSASVPWLVGHTYNINEVVTGSDTQLYKSLVGSNLGVNPVTDTLYTQWTPLNMFSGTWTTSISPVPRAVSNQWQLNAGSSASVVISYPLTSGPVEDVASANAFRLPAGYLRQAAQDPKLGGNRVGWLGAPNIVGPADEDWEFEGNYLVTFGKNTIIFRFIADVRNVRDFDDMFCEGLAAELALAVAPRLQPGRPELMKEVRATYAMALFEARTANGIEIGPIQQPADEYITVRL